MTEQSKDIKNRFTGRSATGTERSGNWKGAKDFDQPSAYFGIERGNRFVRRFKLLFRDGRVISVPYAYLPVIIYNPSQNLKIKTGEMEIIMEGRSLDKLADWLSEEKVLWIKEAPSGTDDETSEVFISYIRVEGDLMW